MREFFTCSREQRRMCCARGQLRPMLFHQTRAAPCREGQKRGSTCQHSSQPWLNKGHVGRMRIPTNWSVKREPHRLLHYSHFTLSAADAQRQTLLVTNSSCALLSHPPSTSPWPSLIYYSTQHRTPGTSSRSYAPLVAYVDGAVRVLHNNTHCHGCHDHVHGDAERTSTSPAPHAMQ